MFSFNISFYFLWTSKEERQEIWDKSEKKNRKELRKGKYEWKMKKEKEEKGVGIL